MDYEKDQSTKSSTTKISSESKLDIKKNQQKDSTPKLPQQQHKMDSDEHKNERLYKKQKSGEKIRDMKGTHQEKSKVQLTFEQQHQMMQERRQLMKVREQLNVEWERLGLVYEQMKEQQEAFKAFKTADEFRCCCIHLKTAAPLIGFLHTLIIIALLITEFCISDIKNLNGFEIAGFVLLGCSLLIVAALFIGICMEKAIYLLIYDCGGVLEAAVTLLFMIFLCIHFGFSTNEELGMSTTGAILLTVFIGILLIALRLWCSEVVKKCSVYNGKKNIELSVLNFKP